MDTVTHAMLGALAVQTGARAEHRLSLRERTLLGAAAAAFPDIDYLGFWLNPLTFLVEWHRGPTHSLVLLPLWALLLGGAYTAVARRRQAFGETLIVCTLGLVSHIATDIITVYGTRIFFPLSEWQASLGTTFVIDPFFTGIIVLALGLVWWRPGRRIAPLGLLLLCLYVGGQVLLKQQALRLGHESARAHGIEKYTLAALPQPFSPFNWKLILTQGPWYYQANVNLAGHPPLLPVLIGGQRLRAMAAAYKPAEALAWERRHRFGERKDKRDLVETVWRHPDLAPFRRFAVYPGLARIDMDRQETCIWFTDYRYDLPVLPPSFRFGLCRHSPAHPWRLYRIRYFSENERQRIC